MKWRLCFLFCPLCVFVSNSTNFFVSPKQGLAEANGKAVSRASKVGKWALLTTDFTEKGGELTPTLKLKRSVAQDIHKQPITELYA